MNNNKKAIVVLDDFFGDDKLTHDMSAREAWDCIKGLLKEQEAVEPKHNPLSPTDWFCGRCGMCISRFHDYCPSCGQAVKWNE